MKSNIFTTLIIVFVLTFVSFQTTQAQKKGFSDKTLSTEIITLSGIETNLGDVFDSLEFNNVFVLIYNSSKTDFVENLQKIKDLQTSKPDFKYVFISTDANKEIWQSLVKSFELIGMNLILRKPVDLSSNDELEIDVNCKIIILNKKKEIVFRENIQTGYIEIDTFMKGLKYYK